MATRRKPKKIRLEREQQLGSEGLLALADVLANRRDRCDDKMDADYWNEAMHTATELAEFLENRWKELFS